MQRLVWKEMDDDARGAALARPAALSDDSLIQNVQDIMADVKTRRDAALKDFTRQFDGVDITDFQVPETDLKAAWQQLDKNEQNALETAKTNIETFHAAQHPRDIKIEVMPGIICERQTRPLESAGLYVPGGTAPLVSTVLMLCVPAQLAGVERPVLVTPPGRNGHVHTTILAAAHLCGIKEVYKAGGAQAIAALSYGTESIPGVAKIFGPGNAYVAMAKSLAAREPGGPAIDLPAGPSEAMVLADDLASPVFVAADILSQAEHDVTAQVMCVCQSGEFADALETEITTQLADLPRRDIAGKSLQNGRLIICPDTKSMLEICNAYAPEHLIMQMQDAQKWIPHIRNAGSVFVGPWTPEAVGDYASGTNHTLPTGGAARSYSGVVLEDFMTYISVQSLTREGLQALGPTVEKLARMEGLHAHERAISLRLKSMEGSNV